MLLSLTLFAAILSAAIAIPRPDARGDSVGITSTLDPFMAQLPGADGNNVLALAGSANPPTPVGTIYTDEVAIGSGRARAMGWYAIKQPMFYSLQTDLSPT